MIRKPARREIPKYCRPEILTSYRIFSAQSAHWLPVDVFSLRSAAARLTAIFICLLYSLVAAGANSPHSGVYMGEISGATDDGQFAVLVRADGSSALAYFDGFDEEGGFKDGINVATDGTFSFQIPTAPFDTASGQIVGTSITGEICCTEPGQFSGTKSATSGFFQDYGGIYRGTVTGTSTEDGTTYQVAGQAIAIVDATGNTMMYIPVTLSIGGQIIENAGTGGMIAINMGYLVSGNLLDGVVMDGSFSATTLTASGTFSYSDADSSASGQWTISREEALPPQGDINDPGSKAAVPSILPLLLNQD